MSNKILGYINKTSFTKNEKINLYINYHETKIEIDIIHFLTKHKVDNIKCTTFLQNDSRLSYAEGCEWKKTISLYLDKYDAGIYIIRLYDINFLSNNFNIPFFIFDDKDKKDIVVISNTNTWNAYNNYGGASFYVNDTDDNSIYIQKNNNTSDVVSFNRPNIRISNEINILLKDINTVPWSCNHLFWGEKYLWKWLFDNKYKYDIISDIDVENIDNLIGRKIIILNCHPEYWSHKMYFNLLKIMKDYTANLIYLGGNGIWRKVYLNHKLNRIEKIKYPFCNNNLNSYENRFSKDIFAFNNKLNIEPYELLGMFYDSTGKEYSMIKCKNNNSWIFNNTGIKVNDIIGNKYDFLKPSGHETDKKIHHYLKSNIRIG